MRPPFNVIAEVAPGADPSADPGTWVWTSSGVRWRTAAGIAIEQGRSDEDSVIGPGSGTATLDDRSYDLSPRNVLGKWFGLIGKNTPARFVLDVVNQPFTVARGNGWGVEPVSGMTWFHTSIASWTIAGGAGKFANPTVNLAATAYLNGNIGTDVDVFSTASIDVVATGAAMVHRTLVRRLDTSNYIGVHTEFGTGGIVSAKIIALVGNVQTTLLDTTAVPGLTYAANTKINTRVRAIGSTIMTKVWLASAAEPAAWTFAVNDTSVTAGAGVGFYTWRVNGNTNSGTVNMSYWAFTARTSLLTGQVPEWPVRWPDKSGADTTAPITVAGLLRYLGLGTEPLRSPIDLQLSSYKPASYWRLEEGSGAVAGGNTVARQPGMKLVGGSFGNDDAPAGALSSVSLDTLTTSQLSGTISTWPLPTTGFAVIAYAKFGALPASTAAQFIEIRTTGRVVRWVVTADSASFNLTGYDSSGATVTSTGGIFYTINPRNWFAIRIRAFASGSNTAYDIAWHSVGSTDFWGLTGTSFSGVPGRPGGVKINAPVDSTLVTSTWVGSQAVPFTDDAFMLVSNGYDGELASDRINRVFTDAGVDVICFAGTSEPLGPQPRAATTMDVVRDAEKADLGLLFERGAVLGYLPHGARILPPVAMALDWALGHMGDTPEPTDDDASLINSYTASRPNGSSRTATDDDSIARYREYPDSDSFNVDTDDQLTDLAAWKVAEGSYDSLRWPSITLDLAAHPELIPLWLGCRVGSRITIANLPKAVAGEVADLVIEGYKQTINKYQWLVELNCSPAAPWSQVGLWDSMRWDAATSTLAAAVTTTTQTSWAIRATDPADWWVTPPAGGLPLTVNGEPIIMTAVTAPVLTGGFYTQTATVTRSATLAKTHAAGESISLTAPGRWGF